MRNNIIIIIIITTLHFDYYDYFDGISKVFPESFLFGNDFPLLKKQIRRNNRTSIYNIMVLRIYLLKNKKLKNKTRFVWHKKVTAAGRRRFQYIYLYYTRIYTQGIFNIIYCVKILSTRRLLQSIDKTFAH